MADAITDSQTDSQPTSRPIVTQAINLRENTTITIGAVNVLENPEDYESWKRRVGVQLTLQCIHDVIDSTIPRPLETDPKYEL